MKISHCILSDISIRYHSEKKREATIIYIPTKKREYRRVEVKYDTTDEPAIYTLYG